MFRSIPRAPLSLGLAGLLPFLWGALTVLLPDLALWTAQTIGPRFTGPYVMLFYGAVILSFMSGVLWGFATKATGTLATTGYVLSVIPALWAFLMTGGGPASATTTLVLFDHQLTFNRLNFGEGAATATIITLIALAIAMVYVGTLYEPEVR